MPETVEQKPVEITLGDGTVVKGASVEDAFKVVAKMKEDTAAALKQERERREALESQYAQTQAELQALKQPKVEEGKFDKQKYYTMLNEDPIAAQNYIDVYRFGTPDPVGRFDEIGNKVDSLYQQSLTASFWARHPEFPGGSEAAKAMTDRVASMTNNGLPLSIDTMELAYSQLTAEETIKPTKRDTEKEEKPNPALGGGGGQAQVYDDAKIAQMSDEQYLAYMRAQGVKGV